MTSKLFNVQCKKLDQIRKTLTYKKVIQQIKRFVKDYPKNMGNFLVIDLTAYSKKNIKIFKEALGAIIKEEASHFLIFFYWNTHPN